MFVRSVEELLEARVHEQHVVLAGHSMGAHGAWHLATHFADRIVGLIAQAGWIAKELYGVDNAFFRYIIKPSYSTILYSIAILGKTSTTFVHWFYIQLHNVQ